MPPRKKYEPHCPAWSCGGGYRGRLQPITAAEAHLTPKVMTRQRIKRQSTGVHIAALSGFRNQVPDLALTPLLRASGTARSDPMSFMNCRLVDPEKPAKGL